MLNIRKFIMRPAAVILSAVMLVGSSFVSGNNIDSATETTGITYIKHYYNSNKPDEEYTLEPLDYGEFEFNNTRALADDPRPNADPTTSLVNIANNGTGFIIGENTIMTAAHCVYTAGIKKYASLDLRISNENPQNNYISLTPVSSHLLKEYVTKDGDTKVKDIAIITVEEDLTDYGILNLGISTNKIGSTNIPLHGLGFVGNTLKESYGRHIKAISDNEFGDGYMNEYDYLSLYASEFYIAEGTSGGPVYTITKIKGNEYIDVIGVVSGGGTYTQTPGQSIKAVFCPRINSDVLQFAYRNSYLY